MLKTSVYKIDNFVPEELERSNGIIWAIWGHNPYTKRLELWCLPELKAYNSYDDVQATVSKLLTLEKTKV